MSDSAVLRNQVTGGRVRPQACSRHALRVLEPKRPGVEGLAGPSIGVNEKVAHGFAGLWGEGFSLSSPEEVPAGRFNVVCNAECLLGRKPGVIRCGLGLLNEQLIGLTFQQAAGDKHE